MKAVVLAGGAHTPHYSFAGCYPALGLVVAGEPVLVHVLAGLRASGITDVALLSSGADRWHRILAEQVESCASSGVNVRMFTESKPRGTAGNLRDLRDYLGKSDFVAFTSETFIGRLDLRPILSFHSERRPGLTVVAERDPDATAQGTESFSMGPDGHVEKFFIIHRSRERRSRRRPRDGRAQDRRSSLRSTGLFVLDPAVLDEVRSVGYYDIKEQLIPDLRTKGVPVAAYIVDRPLPRIHGLADYLKLNADLLGEGAAAPGTPGGGTTPVRLKIGAQVKLPPGVTLVPPVILGDRVTVGKGARIEGPTAIGAGTSIGAGAVVRASVTGAEARIEAGSVVEESFVAPGSRVYPNQVARQLVVVRKGDTEGCPPQPDFRLSVRERTPKRWREKAFRATKRLFDVVASSYLLVGLSPLLLLVALAIRLDSRGPILFKQRRCGRGGRDFTMYKFRSMVADALAIHDQLVPYKDVDGPMFKLRNDPRITRIGRFLRRTSLDELPQLANVLKGDMSMVGPRPLIMREMDFAPGWRDLRLTVKPGLTGLWQVNGRSDTAFHEWISHDESYVRHQSLWLDLRILISTFRVLRNITGGGAR